MNRFPIRPRPAPRSGIYRMRYADGRRQELPIVYGQDLLDWNRQLETEPNHGRLTVAWRLGNERLFKSVWENPWPDAEIASLDFVATKTDAEPFLVAITAE